MSGRAMDLSDPSLIECYKMPFDTAQDILNKLMDDDTYMEPLDVVYFANDSDEVHYFLAFSHITKKCGDHLWSAPDCWGTKHWIAANCPERSQLFYWVLAVFKSSVQKHAFESARCSAPKTP
jgi:hypothetical protein